MDHFEVDELPTVRRRVKALKNLQIQELKMNGQLERERLKVLLNNFKTKMEEIRAKRRDIINGSLEPNKDECHHEFEVFDGSDEESDDSSDLASHQKVAGIPNFWLRAMMNCGPVWDFITEDDEEALKELTDITVKESDLTEDTFKLTLEFSFSENEFFTNRVLVKEYVCKFGIDPKDPWNSTSAPAFYPIKVTGTEIKWKKGAKLTEECDPSCWSSFFEFFSPPEQPKENSGKAVDDYNDRLENDWNLAGYLTYKLVPNAVLFYTGEIAEDEEESDESTDSESSNYSDES